MDFNGFVITANGIVVLNDKTNVDPRMSTIYNSRQDALNGIDALAPTYKRLQGLILFYRNENNKIVQGIFDGGILDEHFILFSNDAETSCKWEIVNTTNPLALKVPTETEWQQEINSWANDPTDSVLNLSTVFYRKGIDEMQDEAIENAGYYWTSTSISESSARCFKFVYDYATSQFTELGTIIDFNKINGCAVRLIVDGNFTQQEYDDNYQNETITIDSLNYGFVYNPSTQKIWLDRNLGKTTVETVSVDTDGNSGDLLSYLFQWGRFADGHEDKNSNTTFTKSDSISPSHGDFILFQFAFPNPPIPIDYNWLTYNDETLWQGVNGLNNPVAIPDIKLIGKNGKKASYNDLNDKPNIVEGIPITGTEENNPVTGDIETYNDFVLETTFNEITFTAHAKIGFGPNSFPRLSYNIDGVTLSYLQLKSNGVEIKTGQLNSLGLYANEYYGAYYTDNTYVQKKYVDDKVNGIKKEEQIVSTLLQPTIVAGAYTFNITLARAIKLTVTEATALTMPTLDNSTALSFTALITGDFALTLPNVTITPTSDDYDGTILNRFIFDCYRDSTGVQTNILTLENLV